MNPYKWLGVSDLGDLATWVAVILSLATAVAGVFVFVQLRSRERRAAMADLHSSLTSGETASARHVIGTLLYSPHRRDKPPRLECIRAYFTLIWSLQRAQNVFRTHLLPAEKMNDPIPPWNAIGRGRMRDATNALTWNLREIADNVRDFHRRYGAVWRVEDQDAWEEICDFIGIPEHDR